ITISNAFRPGWSWSIPSHSAVRMRWPVDETGRNSVSPSTIPSTTACNGVITGEIGSDTSRATFYPWISSPRRAKAHYPVTQTGNQVPRSGRHRTCGVRGQPYSRRQPQSPAAEFHVVSERWEASGPDTEDGVDDGDPDEAGDEAAG